MTNINTLFPSEYLRAADLHDGDLTVTIAGIGSADLGQGPRPVLKLKGSADLVLNKTNGKAIAGLYGDEIEQWVGQTITLYVAQVDFKGDQVDAIRVRRSAPKSNGGGNTITAAQAEELKDLYQKNNWPAPEVAARVQEISGATSLTSIPAHKLLELREVFSRLYGEPEPLGSDDIPF